MSARIPTEAPSVPSPFANAGKDRKSKMPILPSDEVWRQYQAQLAAERMSDEEFEGIWAGLHADAQRARSEASAPFDLARAERTRVPDAEGVEMTESEGLDPDFEYTTDDGRTIDGIDAIAAQAMARAEAAEAEAAQKMADDDLTFEEAVDRLMRVVTRENRYREILRKTLAHCQERRELHAVECEIQTYPEYPYAAQNPYRLIRFLVDNGGIDLLEIDEEGRVIEPAQKVGLTEDEVDDLVAGFQLETTPVGEEVAERLEPDVRLTDLLREFPIRFDSYKEVMEFCQEPRSIKDINALFEGRDLKALGTMHSDKTIPIQPSVFVDKLEHAGVMYWDGKWKLTTEGRTILSHIADFKL